MKESREALKVARLERQDMSAELKEQRIGAKHNRKKDNPEKKQKSRAPHDMKSPIIMAKLTSAFSGTIRTYMQGQTAKYKTWFLICEITEKKDPNHYQTMLKATHLVVQVNHMLLRTPELSLLGSMSSGATKDH